VTTQPTDLSTPSRGRVLVVDDDDVIRALVRDGLEREGFEVLGATDGDGALSQLAREAPDLVILDVNLPTVGGFDVLTTIRRNSQVPVILLTGRIEELDRVLGLELGADDYVAKPFSPRELTARVKAVLRRAAGAGTVMSVEGGVDRLVAGDLQIVVSAREARRGQEVLTLTAREFDLMAFLASRPRRAFRREELLEEVWGYTYGDTATVTVHVRRIREKIEADPGEPRHLVTVWGVGYRWDP